ncbi:hypothetical protein P4O66_001804 [Electrophorus voltai]|uniref:Reverse transcriptase/retrotransposon-derived protein RNase H-like domain-containing protein n=1 Tax=Electrophorus voltai TaxID=2609070 RepID=A0AAD8Z3X0_9TELE|nr:hypothetical protein P4O66_001804 [Electrophorus voltai]
MQAASEAFKNLETGFTNVPTLQQPDPTKYIIMEIHASDVGVGAVLSQQAEERTRLKPVAFFSCKLMPAERNYRVAAGYESSIHGVQDQQGDLMGWLAREQLHIVGLLHVCHEVCNQGNPCGQQCHRPKLLCRHWNLKRVLCIISNFSSLHFKLFQFQGVTIEGLSLKESVIAQKPCKKDSPLHSNQGIEQCCAREVEERTPCLLKVHYSEDQLPSLLELSHEEICAQYEHDPSDYTLRESLPVPSLQPKTLASEWEASNILGGGGSMHQHQALKSQHACPLEHVRRTLGLRDCLGVSLSLYSPVIQALDTSKERNSQLSDTGKFTSFQKVLCKESILSSMPEEFKICCSKAPLDTLTCVDNLKIRPQASGNMTQVIGTQFCEKTQPDSLDSSSSVALDQATDFKILLLTHINEPTVLMTLLPVQLSFL